MHRDRFVVHCPRRRRRFGALRGLKSGTCGRLGKGFARGRRRLGHSGSIAATRQTGNHLIINPAEPFSSAQARTQHNTQLNSQTPRTNPSQPTHPCTPMASSTSTKRAALSIISFLNASIADGSVPSDDAEGIEVAVQCIAEAFGVSGDSQTDAKAYGLGAPLTVVLDEYANVSQTLESVLSLESELHPTGLILLINFYRSSRPPRLRPPRLRRPPRPTRLLRLRRLRDLETKKWQQRITRVLSTLTLRLSTSTVQTRFTTQTGKLPPPLDPHLRSN